MPGVLHHLFFAEASTYCLSQYEAARREHNQNNASRVKLNKADYYLGNILPDLLKKKDLLHFKKASDDGFQVPDLKKAREELKRIKNPSLRLGVFAHLFLDRNFIQYFICPQFNFKWIKGLIYNRRTSKIYTQSEFFSPIGLYYGYSELNRVIVENQLVDFSYINTLPKWPPKTGVAKYDIRREKSWQEELNEYLSNMAKTVDTVFLPDQFVFFIEELAQAFAVYNMYEDFC